MGLQLAAPLLLVLGLSLPENDTVGWSDYLAWAIFAVTMSAIPLLAMPIARSTGLAQRTWPIIVLATAGLVTYWVIVVLPGVTSHTGFLQTAGGLRRCRDLASLATSFARMISPSVQAGAAALTPRTGWLLAGLAATASLGLGWDWYYHPYTGSPVFLPLEVRSCSPMGRSMSPRERCYSSPLSRSTQG